MMFGNGAVRFLHALTAKYKDLKKIYFMAPEFALNARGTYKKAYAGKKKTETTTTTTTHVNSLHFDHISPSLRQDQNFTKQQTQKFIILFIKLRR